MTAASQSTRRKLSLLQFAEELGNVSKACKLMGYHRDTFYEVKRAFQIGGVATLVEQKRGPRNPRPNGVAPDIEKRILDYSLQYPTQGPQRVANQLRLDNVNVSSGGVRGVWLRHDIERPPRPSTTSSPSSEWLLPPISDAAQEVPLAS